MVKPDCDDQPIRDDAIDFDVSGLGGLHPRLRAADWCSPVVWALSPEGRYTDGSGVVEESFHDGLGPQRVRDLRIHWSALEDDYSRCRASYQEPVLAEFAGLGLACISVRLRTGLEFSEVTRRGERADYWLNGRTYLLEVSAQRRGRIQQLFEDKKAQLLSNPFGKNGWVFVVNFVERKARLWFCRR